MQALTQTLGRFLAGDNNFSSQTPWGGWAAFFMSVSFFAFQIVVAMVVGLALVLWLLGVEIFSGKPAPGDVTSLIDIGIVTLLISYALTYGFMLFVGGLRGGTIGDVLLLKKSVRLFGNMVFGIVVLAVFFVTFSLVIDTFFARDGAQSEIQMKQIFGMIGQSGFVWAGVAAIVIGAPFVEETIFRGFLLASLAKTRLGFWGAAAVSSGLWAMLHGYASSMAAGLFVFGMLLSWMVRRTGSIWVSITLHAIWNGGVTLAIFAAMKAVEV